MALNLDERRWSAQAADEGLSQGLFARLMQTVAGNSSALLDGGVTALGKPRAHPVNDNHIEMLTLSHGEARAFIDETIYRARRYGRPFSIVLLQTEEREGSEPHDVPIQILARHIRRVDLCLRLAPENLSMILCPELDGDAARQFADRLGSLIEKEAATAADAARVRIATGTLPGSATTFEGLLGLVRQRLGASPDDHTRQAADQ